MVQNGAAMGLRRKVALIVALTGMALGCSRPAPEPTPTSPPPATPTPLPPTAAATPQPTPTATPEPTPTATPAAQAGYSLRVGTGIAADGSLMGEAEILPAGTAAIYLRVDAEEGIQRSDAVLYRVFRGEELLLESPPLTGADFGVPSGSAYRWIWFGLHLPASPAGEYRVEVEVNGELAARGGFRVAE